MEVVHDINRIVTVTLYDNIFTVFTHCQHLWTEDTVFTAHQQSASYSNCLSVVQNREQPAEKQTHGGAATTAVNTRHSAGWTPMCQANGVNVG